MPSIILNGTSLSQKNRFVVHSDKKTNGKKIKRRIIDATEILFENFPLALILCSARRLLVSELCIYTHHLIDRIQQIRQKLYQHMFTFCQQNFTFVLCVAKLRYATLTKLPFAS